MICKGPDGGEPDTPGKSIEADLVAKVADLESRLEDALRLEREVETQAEIIRVLSQRVEDETKRAEQTAHPLRTYRYKLTYWAKVLVYRAVYWTKVWVYRAVYWTKVVVYRAIHPSTGRPPRKRR